MSVATAAALSSGPIAGSLTDRFVARRAVICARFVQGIDFCRPPVGGPRGWNGRVMTLARR